MTPDGEIFISDIHCRTVSDIPGESGISLADERHSRRSVRFEGLSMLQMEQINRFIHTHTTQLLH